jgi:hypothetical protein
MGEGKKVTFTKETKATDYNTEFEEWLVPARSKIQDSMLELANIFKDRHASSCDRTPEWIAFAWLLGAAFSLWRAVFQAEEGLDQPTNRDAAAYILWTVIRDNSVLYKDEKNSWSFGYYLGNAQFRICAIYDQVPRRAELSTGEMSAMIERIRPKPHTDPPKSTQAWDDIYEAFKAVLQALQTS